MKKYDLIVLLIKAKLVSIDIVTPKALIDSLLAMTNLIQ